MGKSNHFIGQPILKQLLFYLDKEEILKISRENGGGKYIKRFDAWQHLCIMLYAVISRFDSLREIVSLTMLEIRKLGHLGIDHLPRRNTLSDANARRPEKVFEQTCRRLYERHRDKLSSDSSSKRQPSWMKRLHIIDSTTITLQLPRTITSCFLPKSSPRVI